MWVAPHECLLYAAFATSLLCGCCHLPHGTFGSRFLCFLCGWAQSIATCCLDCLLWRMHPKRIKTTTAMKTIKTLNVASIARSVSPFLLARPPTHRKNTESKEHNENTIKPCQMTHTATNATLTHHSHATHYDRMTHLWTKSRLEHARIPCKLPRTTVRFARCHSCTCLQAFLNKRAIGLRVHRSVAHMPSVHIDRTSAPQWQRSWIWRGSLDSELLKDNAFRSHV